MCHYGQPKGLMLQLQIGPYYYVTQKLKTSPKVIQPTPRVGSHFYMKLDLYLQEENAKLNCPF